MQDKYPLISIVLPTYNGSKYLRQSIESCLNQTYKCIELIIVDDGSTEEIQTIIKSYDDPRIIYLRHDRNRGLPTALNTGFAKATGEYLTWTSDDNYYTPDALERMQKHLVSQNCQFVYCDYFLVDDQEGNDPNPIVLPGTPKLNSFNSVGACFLYSSEVKDTVGEYNPETSLAEDYDYWIRTSKRYNISHLSETLYYYRRHVNSLSFNKIKEVRIVTLLVQLKNGLKDIDTGVKEYININIPTKISKSYKLQIINLILSLPTITVRLLIKRPLATILYTKRVRFVLKKYTKNEISFTCAKKNLIKMNPLNLKFRD